MKYPMIISLILLAGCATNPPTKPAQVSIPNVSAEQVKNAIVGLCAQAGTTVVSATNSNVLCSKEMGTGFGDLMYRALATERYASNPERMASFAIYGKSDGVGVSAREWIEHQNAFGKTTKNYVTNADAIKEAQLLLNKLKSSLSGHESSDKKPTSSTEKSGAGVFGKSSYQAKELAEYNQCTEEFEMLKEGRIEIYQATCAKGEVKIIKCEWSNCEVME